MNETVILCEYVGFIAVIMLFGNIFPLSHFKVDILYAVFHASAQAIRFL